jgi:hypothetical protein
MPRAPIELSHVQKREVETLAALLNQDQIADYLGIGRTTFHAIMGRDPDVAERHKRGKAKAIAHVANGLLQKARGGDTTSMIFYLTTQAGWRETDRPAHVTGVQVQVVDRFGGDEVQRDADQFCARIKAMADRIAIGDVPRPGTGAMIEGNVLDRLEVDR